MGLGQWKWTSSALAARRANPALGTSGTAWPARQGRIVLLCSELGQPHLQCWGQLWVTQSEKDIKALEGTQRIATKM